MKNYRFGFQITQAFRSTALQNQARGTFHFKIVDLDFAMTKLYKL